MSINHHPDGSSLIAYSAGSLGEALAVVVTAHLDHCIACRNQVKRLSGIGGVFIDQVPLSAMSESAIDRTMAMLDTEPLVEQAAEHGHNQPTTVERLLGGPLDQARWRRVAPGVQQIRLPLSASATGDLKLLRIGAGRAMPDHGHGGAEMTLVLTGAYADRFGRFAAGDVADLDVDGDHEPTVEANAECICLVASEHQARFKGRLMRMLQPLLRV
jgi:putative transcriptional regulator